MEVRVVIEKGLEQTHFNAYGTLRLDETSEIEIHLAESRESVPGMGEAANSAIVLALLTRCLQRLVGAYERCRAPN